MKYVIFILLSLILAACGGADEEESFVRRKGEPVVVPYTDHTGKYPPVSPSSIIHVYDDVEAVHSSCAPWNKNQDCIVIAYPGDPARLKKILAAPPALFCDLEIHPLQTCLEQAYTNHLRK
jgi:hypothetical protein